MTVDELVQTDPGYALWAALNLSGKKFDKTVALLREALGERYLAAKAESDARARGLARLSEQKSEVNVMRIELLRPLAERMQDGKGGFRDSIAEDLGKGELPRGRGLTLTMEILAKQAGRKGSKGYNEEFERIDAIVGQVENLESGGVAPTPAAGESNPPEGWFVRLTRSDGMGLLNRQAFDTDLLDDDEDQELLELRTYGFQQPLDVPQGAVFAFTPEGLERNQRLIELLTKAAENDVDQQWLDPDDYEVIWESRDGQVALLPLYEDEE
jgi:hypothetical protein